MSKTQRTMKVLAKLIPSGIFGISSALAATQGQTKVPSPTLPSNPVPVEVRLSEIRKAVSAVNLSNPEARNAPVQLALAEWLNFGGWGNGGWHNWGNGWHNWGNGGWGNGGWGNGGWGNGGWHNFWHNW